jgi:hypothetical protein
MLIDVAISGNRNVIKKEAEKVLIYKDLTTETQRMWYVNTKVIPVITAATGTISKSFTKYLSNIPSKHIKELHNTAILTLHTYCGSTDVKYRTLNMGNSITCAINCNYRIAATVCTVETWFVSGS